MSKLDSLINDPAIKISAQRVLVNLSDNRKNEKTHNEKRRGQDCLDQIGQTSRTSKRSKHSLPAIRANWPAPWSPKERPIAIKIRLVFCAYLENE